MAVRKRSTWLTIFVTYPGVNRCGLCPKGTLNSPRLFESNDAVEAGTVQEEEIQRIACCVETVAHTVVVGFLLESVGDALRVPESFSFLGRLLYPP